MGFEIPNKDNQIELIDSNITRMNDLLSKKLSTISEVNRIEIEVLNTENSLLLMNNMPDNKSLTNSIRILDDKMSLHFSRLIMLLMLENQDFPSEFMKQTYFSNTSYNIETFYIFIKNIGMSNSIELRNKEFEKLKKSMQDILDEKNKNLSNKEEIIKQKKDNYAWSNIFQIIGLILIFVGDVYFKKIQSIDSRKL